MIVVPGVGRSAQGVGALRKRGTPDLAADVDERAVGAAGDVLDERAVNEDRELRAQRGERDEAPRRPAAAPLDAP